MSHVDGSVDVRAAFAREVADVNRRRLRVIGPIMVVVHLLHVAVFSAVSSQDALPATTRRALEDLVYIHGAMVPITGFLTVLVFRSRDRRIAQAMGPVVAALYLVHGAVCTAVNLLALQSVTTYVAYCLAMGVILCIAPRAAVIAYGAGLIALVASLLIVVSSPQTFVETMPTCGTITAVGAALASLLHAARRREFHQRLTIERQRDQLGALNSELESRIQAQVGEIVTRATEVDRLNAQLQAQVRERSSELSLALARLAHRRGGDVVLRGTMLGGRFAVGELIGEGGMGAVYDGIDQATGAHVAIKVVQATSAQTLDALRRFAREAGAAAAVAHPAVVRMIDVGISDDGLLFQVQELVDGLTLARVAKHAWTPGDAARLGAVLCDALAAAHAVGVVHRDVKPENLMLTTRAPGLKLLDFGIARLYAAVHDRGTDAMTRTGMVMGTPAYMAPEQVVGATEVSDRADVYATGVILFQLLSERKPFEAESPRAMMMNRLLQDAPSVCTFQASVPDSLARWVDRCLAREPEDRPSAAELASELAAWADATGAPDLELGPHVRHGGAATLEAGKRGAGWQ
jgi:hypothetical protein